MGESTTARIAAVLTCHNRRERTLECLRSLRAQQAEPGRLFELVVHLVDDGSTDGTGEAVGREFPEATVIAGNGDLYWAGGMRRAMESALPGAYDYYLWLNDDTRLDDGAVATLLRTHARVSGGAAAIVVGSIRDPATGALSYGGVVRVSRLRPMLFRRVQPRPEPQRCDTMNANAVLVPAAVVERVGNLDRAFVHATADFDYGLRARRQGVEIWTTPEFVGECSPNPVAPWDNPALTLRQRWKHLTGAKGLPPRAWRVFARRHGGPLWPVYWAAPYLRLALASVAGRGAWTDARASRGESPAPR
ncbi:MAG TPA: glycosyltransferase family 2 protein [Longimicrobium sp.]|nr:glycosyltransferase family 2 protein [Longimicrobium sp.]